MIKFFKDFFNLGKTPLQDSIENPVEPNSINTSWQYQQLRKYSIKNKTDDINNFLSLKFNYLPKFFNDCMNQSIIDGDLILFKEMFLHQRKNRIDSGVDLDNMLDYAKEAYKHDKAHIFEYLIEYYHSQYSETSTYSINHKFINLLTKMIDSNRSDHFDILKKYNLTPFDSYIEGVIDYCSELPIYESIYDEAKRIKFICNNFPKEINNNDLFLYACYGGCHNKPNKELVELFVNAGADIYYEKGEGLINAGKAKALDIVKYLLEESAIKSPDEEKPYRITDKYNGHLSSIASLCAQVKNNDSVIKCFLEHGAFIDIVKYNINKEMYPWLEKYYDSKVLFDELNDELKPSLELSRPKQKKMKV
jgi:hypothetical protein